MKRFLMTLAGLSLAASLVVVPLRIFASAGEPFSASVWQAVGDFFSGLFQWTHTATQVQPGTSASPAPESGAAPESGSTDAGRIQQLNSQLFEANRGVKVSVQGEGAAPQREAKIRAMNGIASQRERLMVSLAKTNPALFLGVAIPEHQRAELPPAVQSSIEQATAVEGTLSIVHKDDFQNPQNSRFLYTLHTTDGDVSVYPVANGPTAAGARVRIRGVRLANVLASNGDSSSVQVLQNAPTPDATGDQKLLVLLVSFQDSDPPGVTRQQMYDDIFNGDFQKFYDEQSYGKMSWSGEVDGWYTMPFNAKPFRDPGYPACGAISDQDVEKLIADNHLDFGAYNRIAVVFNGPNMGGGCSGIGETASLTVNGVTKNVSLSWIGLGGYNVAFTPPVKSYVSDVFMHELGHALGLAHANGWFCADGEILYGDCMHVEYGNAYDTMGSGSFSLDFNAFYKELLGWVSPADEITINRSGTYTINPLEENSGVHLAKIESAQGGFPFYIEYRKAVGYDSNLSAVPDKNNPNNLPSLPSVENTLLINTVVYNNPASAFTRLLSMNPVNSHNPVGVEWYEGWYESGVKAGLNSGESFIDQERGITIGPIISANVDAATFNVALGAPVCTALPPSITDAGAQSVAIAGNNFSFYANFFDQNYGCTGVSHYNVSVSVPDPSLSYAVQGGEGITSNTFNLGAGAGVFVSGTVNVPKGVPSGMYDISLIFTNTSSGSAIKKDFKVNVIQPQVIDYLVPARGSPGTSVAMYGRNISGSLAAQDSSVVVITDQMGRYATAMLSISPAGFDSPSSEKFGSFIIPGQVMDSFSNHKIIDIPAGTYNISVFGGGLTTNTVPFEVVSSSTPSVSSVSGVSNAALRLDYANVNGERRESALVADFDVAISAGGQKARLIKKGAFSVAGFSAADGFAEVSPAVITETASSTNVADDGLDFVIPAGQTGIIHIGAVFNPLAMFAGSYYASVSSVFLDDGNYTILSPPLNKTNTVAILGEISPYITGVEPQPDDVNSALTIHGLRFAPTGNQITVGGATFTASSAPGGTEISFIPALLGIAAGSYPLSVSVPATGASNNFYAAFTGVSNPGAVSRFTVANSPNAPPQNVVAGTSAVIGGFTAAPGAEPVSVKNLLFHYAVTGNGGSLAGISDIGLYDSTGSLVSKGESQSNGGIIFKDAFTVSTTTDYLIRANLNVNTVQGPRFPEGQTITLSVNLYKDDVILTGTETGKGIAGSKSTLFLSRMTIVAGKSRTLLQSGTFSANAPDNAVTLVDQNGNNNLNALNQPSANLDAGNNGGTGGSFSAAKGRAPKVSGKTASASGLVPCGTETDANGAITNPCGWSDLIVLVTNIANYLIILGAAFSAVAFGWAGFMMMTAGGETGKIEQAKSIFTKVLVGFLLMLSAWLIVHAIEAGLERNNQFQSLLGG